MPEKVFPHQVVRNAQKCLAFCPRSFHPFNSRKPSSCPAPQDNFTCRPRKGPPPASPTSTASCSQVGSTPLPTSPTASKLDAHPAQPSSTAWVLARAPQRGCPLCTAARLAPRTRTRTCPAGGRQAAPARARAALGGSRLPAPPGPWMT